MKEKWIAVAGTWEKQNGNTTETALRMRVYDDVRNPAEALGKYIADVTQGLDNLSGFSLSLWQTTSFLVPKEQLNAIGIETGESLTDNK